MLFRKAKAAVKCNIKRFVEEHSKENDRNHLKALHICLGINWRLILETQQGWSWLIKLVDYFKWKEYKIETVSSAFSYHSLINNSINSTPPGIILTFTHNTFKPNQSTHSNQLQNAISFSFHFFQHSTEARYHQQSQSCLGQKQRAHQRLRLQRCLLSIWEQSSENQEHVKLQTKIFFSHRIQFNITKPPDTYFFRRNVCENAKKFHSFCYLFIIQVMSFVYRYLITLQWFNQFFLPISWL